jgi:hypothetical protein
VGGGCTGRGRAGGPAPAVAADDGECDGGDVPDIPVDEGLGDDVDG